MKVPDYDAMAVDYTKRIQELQGDTVGNVQYTYDKLKGQIEKQLVKLKPNDPKRIEAMQIIKLGVDIFHLNDPELKSDPLDVKSRGVLVPPYNDRDELIARAYRRFRDIKAVVSDDAASTYADGIKYILGVNLKAEGTVRGILKENKYQVED